MMPRPNLTPIGRFPDLEIPGRDKLIQLLRYLLSTRGDLLVRGANYVKRLAIGTSGKVLHSDGTDVEWATLLASEVEVSELGTATYDDVQNFINFFGDRTILDGGTITAHGDADGKVVIAACKAWCKVTDSGTAIGKFFDFAGKASQTLTDLQANFIYLDYNAGTPQVVVATTLLTYGQKLDHILLGVVFRNGTATHIHNTDPIGISGIGRSNLHWLEHFLVHRVAGAVTSSVGTRQLAVTAGVVYAGLSRITTNAFNTSTGDTFSYWYYDGDLGTPAWVEVTGQNAISNTQYNDVDTGLVNLSAAAKRGVHWVYLDNDGVHIHVVYGQDDYSTANAELATVPTTLPPLVTNYCVLIAKIIVQKDQDTLYISYPWTEAFQTSLATDHGSLAGLLDDDHAQYVKDTEFTAANDTLVGTGSGTFAKKTPAEVLAILSGEAGAAFSWNAQDLSYIGHIGAGNQAVDSEIIINAYEIFALGDNNWRAAGLFEAAAYKTSAAFTNYIAGYSNIATVRSNNTQAWTNTVGLRGVESLVSVGTGAASPSTITGAACFYGYLDIGSAANDMVLTNFYGLYLKPSTLVGNSKLTNNYGIYIGNQAGGATLNYAIYTNAGLVYFGDNVEIATGKTFTLDGLLTTAESELTLDTDGAITVTQMRHKVDTFEGAASDDLVTINGGGTVNLIILRAEADARTIVVKHGSDNIWLQGKADVSLDDLEDGIMLAWDSTNSKWFDIAAGGGGGAPDAHASTHESGGSDQIHSMADDDDDTKIQVEESADEDIIRMDVAGVEAFHLSAVGELTLAKQSCARAYPGTAQQKIPTNTWVQTKLDAENFDIQNEFDITITSSTATAGTSGTTLVDSSAPFVAGDVGKTVWNDTDGGSTTIAAFISTSEVTLTADIGIASGEAYSFGKSRFTATEAGKYMIVLQVSYPSAQTVADKTWYVAIKKNGAFWMGVIQHSSVATTIYAFANDIIDLAANDYLDHWVWHQAGSTKEIDDGYDHTFLSIVKVV